MKTDCGIVWLVGAGPGDPGLITVKGMRCISEADVIVYDALCNPRLLMHARPHCELIYAGKHAGVHTMKQDDINRLLRDKAAAGMRVCRLKGGDPFVFGRGGEEALYLGGHGIPFEVVPGVSSAMAVPAYAGIPVTHRLLASSVRVITGHEDPTKPESRLDFEEIAATQGTLVFLMGVQNLMAIADRLMAAGKPADTPVAVITEGTSPRQRTVLGTLQTISNLCRAQGIVPPAILVVGEVARLREQLAWFEKRPLFGRRILVTRARSQTAELVDRIEAAGGEAIEAPAIRLESLADAPPMRQAAREISRYHWVVFTSANGVRAFLRSLRIENADSRAFAGIKIAAIGPGTADSLAQAGLRADVVPEQFVAEALLDAITRAEPVKNRRFLVPRADIARPDLVDGLRAAGADVTEVQAYRTVPETSIPDMVLDLLDHQAIDLVTFTSSSTVRNFARALPDEKRDELMRHVRAASIGPITSKTLRDHGIQIKIEAAEPTIPALVAAMKSYFAAKTLENGAAPQTEEHQ